MGRRINIEIEAKKFIKTFYDADEEQWQILGERLKTLREQMGYTKSELAKRACIDRNMLVKYENGECIPKGTTLIKILNALYCDVVEFCRTKGDRSFNNLVERTYSANEENNIFLLKRELDDKLSHALSYKTAGKNIPVPKNLVSAIRKNIDAAFEYLEILNYDDEQ